TGRFDEGPRRVGAEQEMFLVDRHMGPAFVASEVIEKAADPRVVTEIARFNIEANLTPRTLAADCFRRMEDEIGEGVQLVREAARPLGTEVLLAGILPTLQKSDLGLQSITPQPRYLALNDAVMRARGGHINVHIKGVDEVNLMSDNVMPLSSNTSFQVHMQAAPSEYVSLYNTAQAVTAPVLAAAVNSPLWLGNRLWQETRIALFQHSADARSAAQKARGFPTRVGFGERWLEGSVLEFFREDIARFRIILTAEAEDALEVLARGGVPKLNALALHNGTVWWWNRACYGVTGGVPHLRIENRVLPSGPTPLDEVSNAAFLVGLLLALPEEYGDITRLMTFDDAKANFVNAARLGLGAQFIWTDGKQYPAAALILEHLLPLARQGLRRQKVEEADIDRYLGTVEERVRAGQTGAEWALKSLAALGQKGTREMRHRALAEAMFERQQTGEPVHRWPPVEEAEPSDWVEDYRTVGQFMSTDLFTVRPDDLVDLAASVMDWRHVRHVPVEDDSGNLVGLITHRDVVRLLASGDAARSDDPVAVRELMKTDPVTVTPQTPTLEALALMRERRVGCLPVVEGGALVGI
ncbi:MAG TPA: glutamate-cysteine ligase family protein, partial [Pyrinomonadaceae bacterium]|nr:glutamate-cysteine ligase family protein [Pyrinomonadaceae bacterium]